MILALALHAAVAAPPAQLSPQDAISIAAHAAGREDIIPALVAICMRESSCKAIGIHRIDQKHSRRAWASQVKLGHLDRRCQPSGNGWVARGILGLAPAHHWAYAPRCFKPEWFDDALFSATVGVAKWLKRCDGRRDSAWCGRGGS